MSARPRLSLDGLWYFSPGKIRNTDNCPQIQVPAPWQADPRFREHTGTAWYQREFDIPAGWFAKDRVILLGFGAVDYFAEVWVNDVPVGNHEGGYLPFELDVTAAARPGVNTLTVRVDDPLEIFPEIPHGKQSWYGLLSGIWQPVWVESRPATYIQRIKIVPSRESVEIAVALRHALPAHQTLTVDVLAPDGRSAGHAAGTSLNFQIPIESPRTWDIDSPDLYTVRVRAGADELSETFGFRTIETRDGMILLNGRPFYMRAALDQDYYPEGIATPPSQEYIEAQFRQAREMGLNCLRVHIKVADPRYYAAADKVGLLIWTELPNHILLSDEARRRARETLAGMVERDGNHPSIGIWTIINESWGIDLTDPSQRAWLAETYQWMKALDPKRLVVGNSACWGNFHVATDIADFHMYYAMPDHHRQWRKWTESYASRPPWLFAHPYGNHESWREFTRDPWRPVERGLAPEVRSQGDEPLLVSEFGNWGLPDIAKLYDANGGTAPWWFETGLEWGDGVVYPHGMEQRFREYHLDRVFPALSALSEASQRLQFDALKFEIENIRSHPSIQGYVITEFTDLHWECNGLLDMYRNPKVFHSQLRQINADDLLIPLWERLVFSEGESCELDILFSHYSPARFDQAVLEWELTGENLPAASGRFSVPACAPYQVTGLGKVRVRIPRVERPTKVRLQLRLSAGEEQVATEQQLYVFPPAAAPKREQGPLIYAGLELRTTLEQLGYATTDDLSRADAAVFTTLDDAGRDFLLRGGRVLLLAEGEDALQTHIPGLRLEPRAGSPWQGDWASSFAWHRFENIPTGHVVDFAFADLTPDHVILGFQPRDFALDVLAGLFVGWLHKPVALVARRRVGRGEVLVSTFRLSEHLGTNPLAAFFFRELLGRVV